MDKNSISIRIYYQSFTCSFDRFLFGYWRTNQNGVYYTLSL